MAVSLHNKIFKPSHNSDNGEVDAQTRFHYRQEGDLIWATYGGGLIRMGTLIGLRKGDRLEFSYQHVNHEGEILTGKCKTLIKELPEGLLALHEQWAWTCKDFSTGSSLLIEDK